MRMALLLIVALLAGGFATAQDTAAEDTAQERVTLRERLRRAIRLPRTTEEAREAGVPEERVREILRTGRERRIPPDEMDEILVVENQAIREGGPVGNFGAVVQELKAGGLRGRELARAIHAEQVARGMKKPKGVPPGQAGKRGGGPPGAQGQGQGQGQGKGKGQGQGKGRDKGRQP
jgi:hypothetical protein